MPFVLIGVKVNDAYLEYVVLLNSKLRYTQDDEAPPDGSSLGLAPPETVAVQEVLPELDENLSRPDLPRIMLFRFAAEHHS